MIWKSPYSEVFIDFFSQTLYPISRVVDLSDLVALLILPLAFIYHPRNTIKLKVNPIPLAILSFISFCATSVPQPTQKFSQPQYLLLKSGLVEIVDEEHPSRYKVYKLDSLIIVSIKEIEIDKRPPIDDEFHKVQILADVDLRLLRDSKEGYSKKSNLSDYAALRDSLTVGGETSLMLRLDSANDELNFKGTRLDGNFRRSNNDRLLIDGKYKDGIEDSVWTFYNNKGEVVSRKYFQNGELIRTEQFENSTLATEQSYNTRDDVIRNKYFHVAIIGLLIIMLSTRLVLNYRRSTREDIIQVSNFLGIVGVFLLPLVVLILTKSISTFIPHAFANFSLGIVFEAFWIYIITTPLFLTVFYFVKLRTKFDLIFYLLVFALSFVLIEEWMNLKSLMY